MAATTIDKSISTHAKSLIIGFGALVVVATSLTLALTNTTPTKSKVTLKKEKIDESEPSGEPSEWTIAELRLWLSKRYLFPSDDTSKEELVLLVEQQRK